MKILLSGEGPTDLGICTNSLGRCSNGDAWKPGPLAVLILRMLEPLLGYDLRITPESIHHISETALSETTKALPARLKPARGKKQAAETGYFFNNARTLAGEALRLAQHSQDVVVAVLFRDSDGNHRSGPAQWKDKWQSMVDGFASAEFSFGVAMLPRPKSEAWLMAIANTHLTDCSHFEGLPGNDDSPRSAKTQLAALMPTHQTAEDWCDWIQDVTLEDRQLKRLESMESFDKFNQELQRVMAQVRALR